MPGVYADVDRIFRGGEAAARSVGDVGVPGGTMMWTAAALLMLAGCGRSHASFGDEFDNPGAVVVSQPRDDVRNTPVADSAPPPPVTVSAPPPPIATVPIVCGPQAQCPRGSYCDYLPSSHCGEHNAAGKCMTPATACDMTQAPVCGCDGVTYLNYCQASAAGVAVRSDAVSCETLDLDAGFI